MTPRQIELFWRRVQRGGLNDCWRWLGTTNRNGYGVETLGAPHRSRAAHRISYELLVGPIPDGLQLDHLCRVPGCVNPRHLEPVTGGENKRRAAAYKTHCPKGHPYDAENTKVSPSEGTRRCKRCRAAYMKDYWGRKAGVT